MLADCFTKTLQGSLFAKLCDVVMGWKHVDTLQMVPPPTMERVGNVVKFRSKPRRNRFQHGDRRRKNRIQRGDRMRQDRIQRGDKGKRYEKMSPQRGDEGKKKRNAQVVRGHSPRIRLGTT